MRRHLLPYALAATVAVVVLPALVVLPLAPLDGILDVFASAALAIGLSVAAGSVGSTLWEKLPASKDTVFGDLMLWRWLRRELGERRVAARAERVAHLDGDPLLPALQRLTAELEGRDSYMRGHSSRVACHAERIARHMGLPGEDVERIRVAASIHDVGKLFVPHSILMRPSRLDPDEYALVKRHAEQGAELTLELGDPDVTAIVRHHHERIDGAGYPDGLAGDDIPLGARIVAVADTFDAIASDRPYRRAASRKGALDVLSEVAGSQLDRGVVSAFVDYSSGRRSIANAAAVATVPQRLASWIAATPAGVGASAAPIAQGVCAAGAIAVAGICISGTPALDGGGDGGERVRSAAKAGEVERAAGGAGRREVAERGRPGAGPRRTAGGTPGARREDTGGRGPVAPGAGGGAPQRTAGQAPSTTGPSSPQTGGGTVRRVIESPGSVAPDAPVSPPSAPLDPPKLLDPVVDTVDEVLEPAPQPVEDLTDPVEDLLGQTGLTSPAP